MLIPLTMKGMLKWDCRMAKEPKHGQLMKQKTISTKFIKVHGQKEKCKEWVNQL